MNTEKFIQKARKIHGDKYDYSLVEYKHCRVKLKIICPQHGEFLQRYDIHLAGSNCRKCSDFDQTNRKFLTTQEFINKAKLIHKYKYDYSKVEYVNSWTKVIIICPKHGEFLQSSSSHLFGKGCYNCGKQNLSIKRTSTKEKFIKQANKIHNFKYDYSLIEYIGYQIKIKIICPYHEIFYQSPDVHINQKSGCPECGFENMGWNKTNFVNRCNNKNKNGILYLIKLQNKEEEFYKIGITSGSIKRRYSSLIEYPYKFEIYIEFIKFPDIIWELERYIIKKYKEYKYQPQINFKGQTECFNLFLPIEEIKKYLAKIEDTVL